MDDNEDGESQKFLSNGLMKKKKYDEYHEEYVSSLLPAITLCLFNVSLATLVTVRAAIKVVRSWYNSMLANQKYEFCKKSHNTAANVFLNINFSSTNPTLWILFRVYWTKKAFWEMFALTC